MLCPYCGSNKNKATGIDRLEDPEINADKRRRECLSCGETFKTIETVGDINVKTTKFKQRVTAVSQLFKSKVSVQFMGRVGGKTLFRKVEHEEPIAPND